MTEIDEMNPQIERSACAPALTVSKIDFLFKRMLVMIDEELGSDKAEIAKWEQNIRKRFNLK